MDKKEYYLINRERLLEHSKAAYWANQEEKILYAKNYYERNREELQAYQREYYHKRKALDPNYKKYTPAPKKPRKPRTSVKKAKKPVINTKLFEFAEASFILSFD